MPFPWPGMRVLSNILSTLIGHGFFIKKWGSAATFNSTKLKKKEKEDTFSISNQAAQKKTHEYYILYMGSISTVQNYIMRYIMSHVEITNIVPLCEYFTDQKYHPTK